MWHLNCWHVTAFLENVTGVQLGQMFHIARGNARKEIFTLSIFYCSNLNLCCFLLYAEFWYDCTVAAPILYWYIFLKMSCYFSYYFSFSNRSHFYSWNVSWLNWVLFFFFFENVNNVVSSNLAGRDPIWHNGTNTIWALDGCVEFSGINKWNAT